MVGTVIGAMENIGVFVDQDNDNCILQAIYRRQASFARDQQNADLQYHPGLDVLCGWYFRALATGECGIGLVRGG